MRLRKMIPPQSGIFFMCICAKLIKLVNKTPQIYDFLFNKMIYLVSFDN